MGQRDYTLTTADRVCDRCRGRFQNQHPIISILLSARRREGLDTLILKFTNNFLTSISWAIPTSFYFLAVYLSHIHRKWSSGIIIDESIIFSSCGGDVIILLAIFS